MADTKDTPIVDPAVPVEETPSVVLQEPKADSKRAPETAERKPGPPWPVPGAEGRQRTPWRGPPGPPWKLFEGKLTKEEIEVFKDCRRNAFYYRGLPLGVGAVGLTYYAAGRSPFIRRWSLLFYPAAFFFGFFGGMASYRRTCFHRIMALENSTLKERFLEMQKEYPWCMGKRERSNLAEEKKD